MSDLLDIAEMYGRAGVPHMTPMRDPVRAQFGMRADNPSTPKGYGWLGLLKRPDGNVMSELSVGVLMDGREVEIPTLVPGLSPSEISYLLNLRDGDPIPESVLQKAVAHAQNRIANGQSPFKD